MAECEGALEPWGGGAVRCCLPPLCDGEDDELEAAVLAPAHLVGVRVRVSVRVRVRVGCG